MTNQDKAVLEAARLRTVLSMPEYRDTIGKWFEGALMDAFHTLTKATDINEIHAAQGAYKALSQVKDQIEGTFSREEAVLKKRTKDQSKDQ